MLDQEVGELWQDLQQHKWGDLDLRGQLYHETLTTLIEKLLDERACNKRLQRMMEDCGHYTYPPDQAPLDRSVNEEGLAKRDFGIPNA